VCRLKVSDLLFDNGYFVIDFTIKGGKRNRIAVHQELQMILRRYLSQADHAGEPQAPLFMALYQSKRRQPLTPRSINQMFRSYARKVGLPDNVTPHSARATFITQALENNCPIEAVQACISLSCGYFDHSNVR